MVILQNDLWFPDISTASEEGIVAIGGDLSIERLLLAYESGIFPWYNEKPILWWSPPERMVLFPHDFKVSKSLKKTIKSGKFRVSRNEAFDEIIENCAAVKRKNQQGTWIHQEIITAYKKLHQTGVAESFEVWEDSVLVGGLYGINLKKSRIFCGESMFSLVSDASKVAFYYLVEYAKDKNYKLIDCQIYNDHLASLGAKTISRSKFKEIIESEEL